MNFRSAVIGLTVCVLSFAGVSANSQSNLGAVSIAGRGLGTVEVSLPNGGTLSGIHVVTGGAEGLDFTRNRGGTCAEGVNYPAGATCTVNVKFTPRLVGERRGAVVLRSDSGSMLGMSFLHGHGTGPQATFLPARQTRLTGSYPLPQGLAVDDDGNAYVAESWYSGNTSGGGQPTFGDITKNAASLGSGWIDPSSVSVDGAGNVYVNDSIEGLWKLELQSDGSYVQNPLFLEARAMTVDAGGNLYTLGYGAKGATYTLYWHRLQKDGSYAATAVVGGFVAPTGVAVDSVGNVYVSDEGERTAQGSRLGAGIFKVSEAKGRFAKVPVGSGWSAPSAVAVDGVGNVYVNDAGNLSKLARRPDGSFTQTTILLKVAKSGGLAVDGAGNVYVTEYVHKGEYGLPNYGLFRVEFSAPPALRFGAANAGVASADSPQTVTVSNLGDGPLSVLSIHYPGNFPESSLGGSDCTQATTLAAGESCTITVDFSPASGTKLTADQLTMADKLELTTNSLNGIAVEQQIPMAGTLVSHGPAEAPKFSLQAGTYGGNQTLELSHKDPRAVIYYTTKGATPTPSSPRYTGPLTISKSETVRAIAVVRGYLNSPVAESSYSIH